MSNNNPVTNMIVNALEYYDKNMEKNDKLFKQTYYINFPKIDKELKGDLVRRRISMYNKKKEEIFTSKYEIIGIYENQTKTWSWGWAIPKLPKNQTYILRKILNYGLDLEPENTHNSFLRTELITGRFRISKLLQLDLHVAIASYISKMPNVYMYIYDKSKANIHSEYVDVVDLSETSKNFSIYFLFLLDK